MNIRVVLVDILCELDNVYNDYIVWEDKGWDKLLRGIAYNSSTNSNTNEIGTTESTEICETEKKNTEVENDKKVSFDNVTNVG